MIPLGVQIVQVNNSGGVISDKTVVDENGIARTYKAEIMQEHLHSIPVCSPDYGHTLGKVMTILKAKLAIVSTPEVSARFGFVDGAPQGPTVTIMNFLERMAGHILPKMVTAYDFAGSASAANCRRQEPDCRMEDADWQTKEGILGSQWCRYWMGKVRGAMSTLLMGAERRNTENIFRHTDGKTSQQFTGIHRVIFAISISGGTITQVEKSLLPDMIKGSKTDLSTRGIDNLGPCSVLWLHFECIDDFVRALQGYGGIDLRHVQEANYFGRPGKWIDGYRTPTFDLLSHQESDPEVYRVKYLKDLGTPEISVLNSRLTHAVEAGAEDHVATLLELRANPNNIDSEGLWMLHKAAKRADAAVVQTLLDKKAHPKATPLIWSGEDKPPTALEYLTRLAVTYDRDDEGVVQKNIDETLTVLRNAQPLEEAKTKEAMGKTLLSAAFNEV